VCTPPHRWLQLVRVPTVTGLLVIVVNVAILDVIVVTIVIIVVVGIVGVVNASVCSSFGNTSSHCRHYLCRISHRRCGVYSAY
jgi:hypothetical protein